LRVLEGMSNWGKWGEDDQRGSLNNITPAVVRRSASLVKTGAVVCLGELIQRGTDSPAYFGSARPLHFMTSIGVSEAAWGEPVQSATDGLVLGAIHGGVTHIDTFSHIGRRGGKLYNGFDQAVVTPSGAKRLGVETVGGIVTRGVLLDIAGLRGLDSLNSDDLISDDDLINACEQAGLDIEPGDAVLVRTGWRRRYRESPSSWGTVQPGIGPSAALLLAKRDIALVGSDTLSVEAYNLATDKSGDPRAEAGLVNRLHPRLIADLGIPLVELMNLDELAATGRTTFQFVIAPLRIVGGTTSPLNPLAIL
jgi:kynurenine formamidase